MSGVMEMRLRLAISIIILAALAAHCPCFAKETHPQHSAHAVANNGGSGKTPSAKSPTAKGPSTKDAGESKSNSATDLGATIPPPVLPPQGFARQRDRNAIPSVKIVTPRNSAVHNRPGATTTHVLRNAIGQPVAQPKNFGDAQPHASPAVQAAPQPVLRGATAAKAPSLNPPPLAGEGRVGVATLPSRNINGAAVIRPAVPPAGIGGPARTTHGINGTAVPNKR
jgi:hypothetical protein